VWLWSFWFVNTNIETFSFTVVETSLIYNRKFYIVAKHKHLQSFEISNFSRVKPLSKVYTVQWLNSWFTIYPNTRFRHSEDRASWNILIMEANEMHYFSNLFYKVLYMFRKCSLSIIRSISTLYTRYRYLSFFFCWPLLADTNRNIMKNTYCVYTVLRYSW
jgi:hypothetical protein